MSNDLNIFDSEITSLNILNNLNSTKGIGFRARRKPPSKAKKRRNRRTVKGLRKRVSVRGNTISDAIVQINAVIVR